jgi:transposase
MIPTTHPVRVVNQVVDLLNIDTLLTDYKGGGTSSFHPRLMLKVLVYAYLNNIYSSRKIARLLEENIHYMWLSGESRPDFRTINYFRGKRLMGKFEDIFRQVVELLHEEGFVSLQVQYIDGTKLESASNRYTFVWKGSVEKHDQRLRNKVDAVLQQIEAEIRNEEEEESVTTATPELSTEAFMERVARISRKVKERNSITKAQQKALDQVITEALPKLETYEHHLLQMGERNSYSKTDPDATFMRMKEDHMRNGQLKPAYNVQISTENQFITHYGIYQRPGDTATLIPYLESFKKIYGTQSEAVVADAGYGSEQNYEYLLNHQITPFVKYSYFHLEQKRKYKNNPFLPQNLYYNRDGDYLVCPMGQHMEFKRKSVRTTDLGYRYTVSIYQAKRCEGCSLRGMCHQGKGNRMIEINHQLNEYKKYVRNLLNSEEGLYHRSQRPVEPEAVFGQIKHNNLFNRFRLRSVVKVNIEFGLIAMAHNLKKMVMKGNITTQILENRVKSTNIDSSFYFWKQKTLQIGPMAA